MSLYISPGQLILPSNSQKTGLQFSASLIKGIATPFTAYVLQSNSLQQLSSGVHWSPISGAMTLEGGKNGQMLVTPSSKAAAGETLILQAKYGQLTSTVEITIEGSDLLIYTNGKTAYHVPTATWSSRTRTRPDLVPVVQPLLANDVPAANLLTLTGKPCFLLNLNSLLPTYTEQSPNEKLSKQVQVDAAASDLLIYAPDGQVYQVSENTWRLQGKLEFFQVIQPLLDNGVQVANIPPPPGSNTTSAALEGPTDNITCFLLNLNSLLLNPGK